MKHYSDINCDYFTSSEISLQPRPAWYTLSIEDKHNYKQELNLLLDNIQYPGELFLCRNPDCTEHLENIEKFHNDIISACLTAGKKALPHTSTRKSGKNNKKTCWFEYYRKNKYIAFFGMQKERRRKPT